MTARTEEKSLHVTACRACNQQDADPKFSLLTAASTGGLELVDYHHDCAAGEGHTKASIIVRETGNAKGEELRKHLTNGAHGVHKEVFEHTLREAALSFVVNRRTLDLPAPSGAELREYFKTVAPRLPKSVVEHINNLIGGQMSAVKQGRATNWLNAEFGAGSFTARTGSMVLELDTAVGSQSASGTPVSGGSYADQVCAFGTASVQTGTYSGQIANSGTPTYTNMPATTIVAVELKDSAGTPVHLAWGNLNSSKTTNVGDTVSVAVGAITVSV